MRFLNVILFFIFITHAYSQQLRVDYAKYASIQNGKSLKQNDTLSIHNEVIIKEDGELHLINKTGWGFYLNKGTFDIDSCYQLYKEEYRDYDSVKVIIDTIYPNGINGRFRSVCGAMSTGGNAQELNYKYGNIAFLYTDGKDVITVSSDTLTIYWRDPQKYSGRYIIEFKDLFDDVLSYRVCKENKLHFGINDFTNSIYKSSYMILTVYSEDGRKSSKVAIQIKK